MVKKKQKNPEWLAPLIIVLMVLGIWILFTFDFSLLNTATEENKVYNNQEYTETVDVGGSNTETYCINGDCYTTITEYNQALEKDQAYKNADSKFTQHSEILSNDAKKTSEAYNDYCVNIDMSGVPNCVNVVYPRLEAYATHIVNAQSFMMSEGAIFSNQQELLANMDEHSVYVKTVANNLDSMVNQYNSWVLQQQNQQAQAQQDAEALSNIIKILAMGI